MPPTSDTLKKWEKELPTILHPTRLAILIVLYGAKVLEEIKEQSLKEQMLRRTLSNPKGFIQIYFGILKSANFLAKRRKFTELRYLLIEWPIKFCLYLTIGKGILLPYKIKKY